MKKCISIILIFTILINALFPNYIFAGKNGDNYANVVGSKDETTAREDVDKFFNTWGRRNYPRQRNSRKT